MSETLLNTASNLREQYLEYGFLGELCREMWRRGAEMDILRSHTDRNGYDIVLEANGIVRHVQLKSSFVGGKAARQKINVKLAARPSGCVIWVMFDPHTLELKDFLWFGASPGDALPDLGERVGRHSKANKEGYKAKRSGIRVLNKGQFGKVPTIEQLADHLFERDIF